MLDRPDIVVFLTDQQRADQVGLASEGLFETPALDRWAATGVVFDAAYSMAPVCVPARTGLMTGLHPHRVPTQDGSLALREGHWTVAHALRAAGYQTALVGKMHFTPVRAHHGFEIVRSCEDLFESGGYPRGTTDDYGDWLAHHGHDDWRRSLWRDHLATGERPRARFMGSFPDDASVHPTGWIEREAVEVLRTRDRSRPLFLVVSFPSPHPPYNPPEPYASRYDPAELPLPPRAPDANDGLPEPFRLAFRDGVRARPADDARTRRLLTMVRALVRHIDDAMAVVGAELDLARTTCFFTSDHGDYAGHRDTMMKVPWIPFDDLVRVPFVVWGAGVAGGRHVAAPVLSADLVPTSLALAGVDGPTGVLDAWDQHALLADAGQTADPTRAVCSATSTIWPMVRVGCHKLIGHRPTSTVAVFDLAQDPDETRDLASTMARDELEALATPLLEAVSRGPAALPEFPPDGRG